MTENMGFVQFEAVVQQIYVACVCSRSVVTFNYCLHQKLKNVVYKAN